MKEQAQRPPRRVCGVKGKQGGRSRTNLKDRGRQVRQVGGPFCEPDKPGQGLELFSLPDREAVARFKMKT